MGPYRCVRMRQMMATMPRRKPTTTADLPPGISLTPHGTYRARWRDANHKQQSETFKRLHDATAHLESVKTDLRRGLYLDPARARITVRAMATEWIDGAMNLRTGGRETYQRDLDRYILPEIGDLRLFQLNVNVIDELLSGLLNRGLASATVVRVYETIRRMCNIAVAKGRLLHNPCDSVTPPKVKRTEMRFLDIAQVAALTDAISPRRKGDDRPGRYQAWVLLAAYGGARWSECVGLRRSSVAGNRVRIGEQLILRRNGEWERSEPKTAAGHRTIALPKVAADALALHLDTWSQPGPDGLVFPNGANKPMDRRSFTGANFKKALVNAGIEREVRIHDLRHTAVALAIRAGAHPKAIQSRMGHASITITLDRYGHLYEDMDDQIAERLDDMINPPAPTSNAPRQEPRATAA